MLSIRIFMALVVALALSLSPSAARAAEKADLIRALAEPTAGAIEAVAALGDDAGLAALEALRDGNLFVWTDDAVLRRVGEGAGATWYDAATGAEVDAPPASALQVIELDGDLKALVENSVDRLMSGAAGTPRSAPADFEALAKGLAAEDFPARIAAVERLSALDDRRVPPLLEAMRAGRLFAGADGVPVIADGTTATAGLAPVTINNRLRSVLDAVIARFRLGSDVAAERREAALAMLRERSPDSAPALRSALGQERDGRVREALEAALAAAEFATLPREGKLAAIAALGRSYESAALAVLRGIAAAESGDEEMSRAAAAAIAGIDRGRALLEWAQLAFQGLSLGAVLLLAAMGLAITFGVMGVINMAHGEMVMIGAYTTFVVQQMLRASFPGLVDWSLAIAVPAAFLVAGAVGVAIERGLIRFLYGRPLETLLMTWGLSMILQQAVRSAFGPTNKEVSSPSWLTGAIELGGGIVITQNRIWILVFALAVLLAVVAITRWTPFGLHMRAVTQNRGMAAAMGIRTDRVDALTFGLGSGIAGLGGVALSQIDNVSPNLGQSYIVDSFMVVVFGGVGNLFGTLIGAGVLGIANKILEPFAGAVLGKILVLAAIILFIQRRPRGLFALRGRMAEG